MEPEKEEKQVASENVLKESKICESHPTKCRKWLGDDF